MLEKLMGKLCKRMGEHKRAVRMADFNVKWGFDDTIISKEQSAWLACILSSD